MIAVRRATICRARHGLRTWKKRNYLRMRRIRETKCQLVLHELNDDLHVV